MDFAARMIMSLWIISACILRGVGVASNDDNYCESDFPNLHAPCLQQQPTLGVPLTTARASRTAKILMPTDLANSLPPKNFSLKSLDHSVSIGGKITTDYFTVEEAKRWNVSLSFSTLPNELKHITLVQLTYTVVNFTGVDEFLSTIHIHVGDTFYEWQFLLFHKQNLTSSEGTSTTPVIPTESEGEAGKPYPNPFILSISVNVVLLIPIIIWICFPHQTERWRSQNCLLRRIESAIHGTQSVDSSSPHLIKYTNIPQRDSSSPGEASTDTHEMEVRVPMADINQDSGNLHEQDESHQIPTTGGSPCSGQANGETCVLHVEVHPPGRVDPTEQRQPEAESNLHAPTEACTGTLSALGDEKTEPEEEDIVDLHTVGLGKPETQEIQAQEELIQPEDTDLESDSDD